MSDRMPSWGWIGLALTSLAAGLAFAGPSSDPTRPPDFTTARAATEARQNEAPLELQAVFFAEGRRVAIINGERLRVDDRLQSARVVRIERDRVSLRRDGETIELRLVETDVKRPSPPSTLAERDRVPPALSDLPAAPAPPEEGSHR